MNFKIAASILIASAAYSATGFSANTSVKACISLLGDSTAQSSEWSHFPSVDLSQFQLEREIQTDGLTADKFYVYKKDGHTYFVKRIPVDDENKKIALNEARLLTLFNPSQIAVHFYGIATIEGQRALVLDYVDGGNNTRYGFMTNPGQSIHESALEDIRKAAKFLTDLGVHRAAEMQFMIDVSGKHALLIDPASFDQSDLGEAPATAAEEVINSLKMFAKIVP